MSRQREGEQTTVVCQGLGCERAVVGVDRQVNAAAERIWISLQGDGKAPSCDGVAEVGSIQLTKPMYCTSLQSTQIWETKSKPRTISYLPPFKPG